jgi:hypothetical protein
VVLIHNGSQGRLESFEEFGIEGCNGVEVDSLFSRRIEEIPG